MNDDSRSPAEMVPLDPASTARVAAGAMLELMYDLSPLCRSITGPGLRDTYRQIGSRIPLEFSEIPSGTQVFDWTVPDEWAVKEAYVESPDGRRIVDWPATVILTGRYHPD